MSTPTAYPLAWPTGWKRTKHRTHSRFGKWNERPTVSRAAQEVEDELERLGATLTAISTNVAVTLSGRPRSGQRAPDDPGVAVYFRLHGEDRVLACDRWNRVGCNLWAIAKHIAALRGIDRWGVGSVAQAFTGYAALPAQVGDDWRAVLGFPEDATPSESEVIGKHRGLAFTRHPDRGGTDAQMAEINRARDAALREIRAA